MAEPELSPPPAPWPNRDGYVHPDIHLRRAYEAQLDRVGPIIPLGRKALAEFRSRDVGANDDAPIAEVYPEGAGADTVTMVLDSKTAAVVLYAARLMASNYETHALEVRAVAEQWTVGSWGATNRIESARRHERVARRLRVLEVAYRDAINKEYHGI